MVKGGALRRHRTKLGANSGGTGAHNRRVVVQALRLNERLSRAEIARETGLVPQTVSNIIEELEADGLVRADEPVKGRRGQPATPYAIAPAGAFALGAQLDQHRVRTVAVNMLGRVVAASEASLGPGGLERNMPRVRTALDAVLAALREGAGPAEPKILGLGLAMPAPTGVHADPADPWMSVSHDAHPILAAFRGMTDLPVSLHHDASAACVAERLSGCAVGIDNFVQIFVSYGLGAGLYVKGELHSGDNHLAGEIGQIPVRHGGRSVPVEAVVSLASLCARLDLRPNDPALFATIDRALDTRPGDVGPWLRLAAKHLAWLVELLECVLDPECIVLSGQLPARLMAGLFERVRATPRTRRPATFRGTRLLMGSTDAFSVAAGAASYPIARTFDPTLSAISKAI